jgi:hypothetical protein
MTAVHGYPFSFQINIRYTKADFIMAAGSPMTPPQKYPLGIQTFSEIREQNYLYLDKTALIYDLISTGKVYFLSRPRRFGKSLLISTLESLFLGQKSLFDGLAIASLDYDFKAYPVIKLEFTKVFAQDAEDLKKYIFTATSQYAKRYDITLESDSFEMRFDELVCKLHEKTAAKVVLLIDEYDKPILSNLNKPALTEVKEVMNGFYSVAKSLDEHLQFVFITGVSKFAKVSVFSGMNNLTDISMDRQYATLCGVTQQELEANFAPAIDKMISAEGINRQDLLDKIKYWYNGYRFHQNATTVYNPYSVLALCRSQEFDNYWFTTATPTFLIELIKARQFDLTTLNGFEVDKLFFAATEPEQMTPEPVLLQTGYLTIVDFNDGWYQLGFPNFEVEYAFNRAIVQEYGQTPASDLRYIRNLSQSLSTGDIAAFIKTLRVFFANIPYEINLKHEKYYQSLFYAIFTLLGYQLEAEVSTNDGRIDCVLKTDNTIYIIEFKLNGSKEDALQQIEDKQYAQKYLMDNKGIVLLGVEFDQKSRNIGGFVEKGLM